MNQIHLAYEILKTKVGQKEVSGSKDNPLIVEMHQACTLQASDDETPWCSSAVNWAVILAGIMINPESMNETLYRLGYQEKDIDAFFLSAWKVNEDHIKVFDSAKIFKRVNHEAPKVVMPTRSAMARSWLLFGTPTKTPQQKDIVIYSRGSSPTSGHVGFVEKMGTVWINTLGGNQDNMVNFKDYARVRVLGYRRL